MERKLANLSCGDGRIFGLLADGTSLFNDLYLENLLRWRLYTCFFFYCSPFFLGGEDVLVDCCNIFYAKRVNKSVHLSIRGVSVGETILWSLRSDENIGVDIPLVNMARLNCNQLMMHSEVSQGPTMVIHDNQQFVSQTTS